MSNSRRFPRLLFAVIFVSSSLWVQKADAQAGGARGQPKPDPVGTIDGSRTPELISAEVAFLMIVRAFAEPANATPQQAQRAEARMSAIGLTGEDAVAFKAILVDLLAEIQKLDVSAQVIRAATPNPKPGSLAWAQLGELNTLRQRKVQEAMDSLPVRLTAEGVRKVHEFWERAKRLIKIYPGHSQ